MTMEPSQAYVSEYLHAGDRALEEARILLEKLLLNGAASRAYYAMFYAASAALLSQGLKLAKKHKTVITLFYQHFVKNGMVPRRFHQDLVRAFKLRQQSDYEIHEHVEAEVVREAVEKAEAFVAEVKKVLGSP